MQVHFESDDLRFLLLFEEVKSPKKIALALNRDESIITRQIQRIVARSPVMEKLNGRWVLTVLGHQVNQWTRSSYEHLDWILKNKAPVRIAAPPEFASRILSPAIPELKKVFRNETVSIVAAAEGIEQLLLDGRIDIGFDCGRPEDPAIRYRLVAEEPFVTVASPAFYNDHRNSLKSALSKLPHLKFKRDPAESLMNLGEMVSNVQAVFSDLSCLREACIASLGWAVMPRYAVMRELESGQLKEVPSSKLAHRMYGVWWLRTGQVLSEQVTRATQWLKSQTL